MEKEGNSYGACRSDKRGRLREKCCLVGFFNDLERLEFRVSARSGRRFSLFALK